MRGNRGSHEPIAAGCDGAVPPRQEMWTAIGAMDQEVLHYIRRRIPLASEAEDVLHDCYLRVFEHADSLRDRSRLRPWLYRVLRSALVDHVRAKRRDFDVVTRLGWRVPDTTADASLPDHVAFAALLAELKPEYADILLRLQVRADTPCEAAADLGTTQNNIRVRHFRARAALRDAYAKTQFVGSRVAYGGARA